MSEIRDGEFGPKTSDQIDLHCAWSDYRKEYGVMTYTDYLVFKAGWDAARGMLDIGGVQR